MKDTLGKKLFEKWVAIQASHFAWSNHGFDNQQNQSLQLQLHWKSEMYALRGKNFTCHKLAGKLQVKGFAVKFEKFGQEHSRRMKNDARLVDGGLDEGPDHDRQGE